MRERLDEAGFDELALAYHPSDEDGDGPPVAFALVVDAEPDDVTALRVIMAHARHDAGGRHLADAGGGL